VIKIGLLFSADTANVL